MLLAWPADCAPLCLQKAEMTFEEYATFEKVKEMCANWEAAESQITKIMRIHSQDFSMVHYEDMDHRRSWSLKLKGLVTFAYHKLNHIHSRHHLVVVILEGGNSNVKNPVERRLRALDLFRAHFLLADHARPTV